MHRPRKPGISHTRARRNLDNQRRTDSHAMRIIRTEKLCRNANPATMSLSYNQMKLNRTILSINLSYMLVRLIKPLRTRWRTSFIIEGNRKLVHIFIFPSRLVSVLRNVARTAEKGRVKLHNQYCSYNRRRRRATFPTKMRKIRALRRIPTPPSSSVDIYM